MDRMGRVVASLLATLVASALPAAAPRSAAAGGQLVGDNGSQGTQRAGAFVAKADDPTALWFNPAGFVLGGSFVYVGANLVDFDQRFRRAGAYAAEASSAADYVGDPYPEVEHQGGAQPVPMIAAGIGRGRWALGFGVMAPHGYGRRDFPLTVDTQTGGGAPAPQRYDTIQQQAMIVLPSVALAVKVSDRLAVGARASLGYARLASRKAVQGVANGAEDPAQDSIVTLAARDAAVPALAAGLHYRASAAVEVGVHYTAPVRVHAVGTSSTELGEALREPLPGMVNGIDPVAPGTERCAPGGVEGAIAACLDVTLPQTATVGLRYLLRDARGAEVGDVELYVRWEDWSAASDLVAVVDGQNRLLGTRLEDSVVRHGFRDTWSVRLGTAGVVETAARRWHVRGGVAYETAAAPDSWARVDVDGAARMTAGLGLGLEAGAWRVDLGGAVIAQPRRNLRDVAVDPAAGMDARAQPDIGVPLNPADAQPYNPFNAGAYESGYWIASFGLTRAL